MRCLVVLPTYQEADNITAVLQRVRAALPSSTVLVVDDSSPDGTAELAEATAAQLGGIEVIRRPAKRGLGRAYRSGFEWGLARQFEVLVEMDADLSHDPADVPRLCATVEEGADLVIGSRYVRGSKILGWGPLRYLNSHVANRLARLVTGVPANDATNGLRLFRRTVLETLNLKALLSRGYSVILETNYRTVRAGFRIVEVPITFHPREAGNSKMGFREIYRFCVFLMKLRFQRTPAAPTTETRKAA